MTLDVRMWLRAVGFDRFADVLLRAIEPLSRAFHANGIRAQTVTGDPDAPAVAERRRLSVMFVDLVDSTKHSNRFDPEDLLEVTRKYQEEAAIQVARYGGHLVQYQGDGVLAYFGYPVAREYGAERSVRAALAVLQTVAALRLPDGDSLAVRIGIATGLVVVGDLHGQGTAIGETPNLAARLQGAAQPGQIVVSARTRDLISHLFELQSLGPQNLKGIATPVMAYEVLRELSVKTRFDAQSTGRLGGMVGRERELEQLRERWRNAVAGEGQVVVITGEAGIGKSRIVRALQDALGDEPHLCVHFQCSPYHADSALFPLIHRLSQMRGMAPAAGSKARLDELEALLGCTGAGRVEDVVLIAALLGIDSSQRYGPLNLLPQQERQRTFDTIINQAIRAARRQPLLVVIEDAHWIDPTTLELVELSVNRLASSRALILITARPDFQHDFVERRNLSGLVLSRLGQAQIAEVVNNVTRGKALPRGLMQEIGAKTDGVPLFAEELTKTVLESGVLQETDQEYVLDRSQPRLAVPESLYDSLMARLDRLKPIKEVAQTAACIGREFDYLLLAAIMPLGDKELRDALRRLAHSELIFCRGTPPQVRYTFKHTLVRDAAYESLLKSTRQEIHCRLAEALEARPDTARDLLAHHATQAGLTQKAIDYWQQAAEQALAIPAYQEAMAHLNQALRLTEQMGESLQWLTRRLHLLLLLGQASIPLHGYGHEHTIAIFTRAQELSATLKDTPHRTSILFALWGAQHSRGEQAGALVTARTMDAWARKEGNPSHMLTALRSLAISQMITGAPMAAAESFEQAKQISGLERQRTREQRIAIAQRFAVDPEIATQFYVALTAWCLGSVTQSHRLVMDAVDAARKLGHAHTLGRALAHASIHAVLCRDVDQALALTAETIEYAERHDLSMWKGYGLILRAFALALAGDHARSAVVMESGFSCMLRTQTGAMVPLHRAVHARTLAALGRYDDAAQSAAVARTELHTGSERYFWAESQRLLGEYLELCPARDPIEVEGAYQRALGLAREQQARSWELYAALSLARHWFNNGEPERARHLLSPVYAGFTDGHELHAFKEAGELLRQLT